MPDTTTTDTADDGSEDQTGKAPDTGDPKNWEAEASKWRDLARKHEERSKANATAAKELEQLRAQSMSETDKAVAQAKAEGRMEGLVSGAAKVAAAEIRAAAAGRPIDIDALLEGTNLAVFIGEDGEVDRAKVARFVDGITPKPTEDGEPPRFPDLGQGARGGGNQNAALNGDPLMRDIKSKLGIR